MFSVSAMAAQTKQPNGGYLPVSLYKSKRVNSSYGSMDIDVPQDRKSTFEPQIVKKRQKVSTVLRHQKALFQMLQIKFCLRSKTGKIDRWMRYIRSSI